MAGGSYDEKMIRDHFIGVQTCESAEEATRSPCIFKVYYQRPSKLFDLPARVPLFIVYRSSAGEIYHFRIVKEGESWHVQGDGLDKFEHASLASLIKYYLDVAHLPSSRKVELPQEILSRHFFGMHTCEGAADATTNKGRFRIYYQRPSGLTELPDRLPLFVVYRIGGDDDEYENNLPTPAIHFPIVNERERWHVQGCHNERIRKCTLAKLIEHYTNYVTKDESFLIDELETADEISDKETFETVEDISDKEASETAEDISDKE